MKQKQPIYIQVVGRIQRPISLLTHDQLVDWLIYHRPSEDTTSDVCPFEVSYHSSVYSLWNMRAAAPTPWEAYDRLAGDIIHMNPHVHREITDLYWYWTIY